MIIGLLIAGVFVFIHTHHIWGTRYNEPEDLRLLCIGCHSEQPGENHYRLKGTLDYRGFMKRYGRKWRRANGLCLEPICDIFL